MIRRATIALILFAALPAFGEADLGVTLTFEGTPYRGRELSMTMFVTNHGSSDARDVHVVWQIDSPLGFTPLPFCTRFANTLDCRLGDLAPHNGKGGFVKMTMGTAPIRSNAVVTSPDDANAADNSASLEIAPIDQPHLVASITAPDGFVKDRPARIDVNVENRGAPARVSALVTVSGPLKVTATSNCESVAENTYRCAFSSTTLTRSIYVTPIARYGEIKATVVAAAEAPLYRPDDATAMLNTTTATFPALIITGDSDIAPDGTIAVRYTITNDTTKLAKNIAARLINGSDLHPLSAMPPIPDLAPFESFRFTAAFAPATPFGRFRTTLTAKADTFITAAGSADAVIYRTFEANSGATLRHAITNARDCPCRIAITGTITPAVPLPPVTQYDLLIEGGAIRGGGYDGNGLTIARNASVTIRNVAISGFTRGIVSDGQLHISDSAIEDNVRSGIFITGGSAFITDNRITGNGASGIYAADDTDASIGGNTIAGNGDFALALARNAYAVAGANSMYDNGRFAVDVGIDGPTPLFAPAITSARYDEETGDTIIALSASYTDTLYLFASPSLNRAGFAEAKEPVWSGGSRVVRVHRDLGGQYVTALGQRQVIRYGDSFAYVTSELSPGVQVK